MTSVVSRTVHSSDAETFSHGINHIAISSDGRYVATGDVDMNVIVRSADKVVFEWNFRSPNDKIRPTERIRGMGFSPNRRKLYVAAGESVYAIDVGKREIVWNYTAPRSFGFLIISPISLDVASDGNLVAAFDNGSMIIWNDSGEQLLSKRDNDSPRWLCFADSGQKIVGTDSFSICSWELNQKATKHKMYLKDRAYAIDVNRSGTKAVIRNLQGIAIWDLVSQLMLSSMKVGPGIPAVAYHPHRDWVAYAEKNRIRISTITGETVAEFELAVASALSLTFTPNGRELLIGCTMNKLIRRRVDSISETA
jgi:WD40 repeat protein